MTTDDVALTDRRRS